MDEALTWYEEAKKAAITLGEKEKEKRADIQVSLGNIYEIKGKWEEALQLYASSLQIYEDPGDKQGISGCFIGIGIVYEKLGRQEEANGCYERTAKLCEEMGLQGKAQKYWSWIK